MLLGKIVPIFGFVMPEGPEFRRFADTLNTAISGKPIVLLTARTRGAIAWLCEHPGVLALPDTLNRRC